eukprot:SAG11_NODE_2001_length_3939_cov_26.376672_1_plen_61_part_00
MRAPEMRRCIMPNIAVAIYAIAFMRLIASQVTPSCNFKSPVSGASGVRSYYHTRDALTMT